MTKKPEKIKTICFKLPMSDYELLKAKATEKSLAISSFIRMNLKTIISNNE